MLPRHTSIREDSACTGSTNAILPPPSFQLGKKYNALSDAGRRAARNIVDWDALTYYPPEICEADPGVRHVDRPATSTFGVERQRKSKILRNHGENGIRNEKRIKTDSDILSLKPNIGGLSNTLEFIGKDEQEEVFSDVIPTSRPLFHENLMTKRGRLDSAYQALPIHPFKPVRTPILPCTPLHRIPTPSVRRGGSIFADDRVRNLRRKTVWKTSRVELANVANNKVREEDTGINSNTEKELQKASRIETPIKRRRRKPKRIVAPRGVLA